VSAVNKEVTMNQVAGHAGHHLPVEDDSYVKATSVPLW
jgi:hypothetical protein